jgi:hypothetical protein
MDRGAVRQDDRHCVDDGDADTDADTDAVADADGD